MRRVLVPAFALAFAGLAQQAAAQAPAQFDLVCHGSAVGAATGFGRGGEITARFRVDMVHNTFCVDACTTLMPISAVAGDEVEVQVETAAYTLMPETQQFAYRSEVEDEAFGGGGCEIAPFSGFPK